MKRKGLRILLAALAIALLLALAFAVYPIFERLNVAPTEEKLVAIKEQFDKLGFFKYPAILLLQILQVVVALIPGEPVEILAGYLCGTLGGLAVCLLGIAIGTAIIYGLVMRLGKGLVLRVGNSRAYEKLRFLHHDTSRDALLFLLFFIPGTPKDFLTYFAPLLRIGIKKLLVIVTVARIPSVVSSTYLGATLSKGDLRFSVFLFALIGAVGLLGILLHDPLLERVKRRRGKDKKR